MRRRARIVEGPAVPFGPFTAYVIRVNTDGSLDSSFANAGTLLLTGNGSAEASAITVAPNGKIFLAGTTQVDSGNIGTVTVWSINP